MPRPTIDRNKVLEYTGAAGIFLVDWPVIAFGLRAGLDRGGANKIGTFDDIIGVLTGDVCEAFDGNTDPSTEVAGRANLVVGAHWFKPGVHHPGTPKAYPAFVQDGPIIVFRYGTEKVAAGTKDARGLCQGNGRWIGDFAIHLHDAKGVNTTGSEGCQTVITTEWKSYHDTLLGALTKAKMTRFPYVLVDVGAH